MQHLIEAKIEIDSFIIGTILTIAFAIINYKSKMKDEKEKEIKAELKLKANEADLVAMGKRFDGDLKNHALMDNERYQEHRKYDSERYEEIRSIMEHTQKTVSTIEKWIVEGKIQINKN